MKNPFKPVTPEAVPAEIPKRDFSNFGRPPKYTKATFKAKIVEFLKLQQSLGDKACITKLAFCVFAGVDKEYISTHNKGDGSKLDFSVTIKPFEAECEHFLQSGGMSGTLNTTMAIFSLKNNYDWKDKTETDANVNLKGEIKVIKPKAE